MGRQSQDQALIESYRTETSKKLQETDELKNPAAPIVFQGTRCAACGGHLELASLLSTKLVAMSLKSAYSRVFISCAVIPTTKGESLHPQQLDAFSALYRQMSGRQRN